MGRDLDHDLRTTEPPFLQFTFRDAHHKPGGGDMYDYHHLIINSASMQKKKKKSDSIYRVIILKYVQNLLPSKAEIFIILTFKHTDLLESISSINILTRDHY